MAQHENKFGVYEDGGLRGSEEIPEEEKRTKEKKSAHRGDFLAVEDIPNWFNDIGEERGDALEQLVGTDIEDLAKKMAKLDRVVQDEIAHDIEARKARGFFKTKKELYDRVLYMIEKNLEHRPRIAGAKAIEEDATAQRRGRLKK